jgi:hypothetical protein
LPLRFRRPWSSSPHRLTRPASAPFRARATGPYPAGYAGTTSGGASIVFPVSRCLSATGIRFSGRPAPAVEFSFPHGRPTRRLIFVWTSTGFSRSARDRYDRGGCPLYPGGGGALPPGQIPPGGTRRLTAAGPYLPLQHPIGGSANDEASTRLHAIHPSGLPQPVAPGWNGNPWALHPGLRTPRLPAAHAEAGTVPTHWTGHYTIDISRPPSMSTAVLVRPRVARSSSARRRCWG